MSDLELIAVPSSITDPASFGFTPCEGGVCASAGISAAGVHAGFRDEPERKDMALVAADKPCVCAATFTKNCFCAAPVQVSRERAASGHAQAVILNSGNANASTGEPGVEVAKASTAIVAHELGCAEDDVLVGSTGVIGKQLPLDPYKTGVPAAVAALDHSPAAAHDAARAVMTTDTVPKEVSLEGPVPCGKDGDNVTVHVGGFVKGSGMIQPNMATMLCVLSTDAPLTARAAQAALSAAVSQTFNKVTVDSDTSTNDTCILLATGAAGGEDIEENTKAFDLVATAIRCACENLARKIAADGEGATKLVTVDVVGAPNDADADTVARSIANSPLVKTAIFGHDANWGRIAAAAGKCGIVFDQYGVDIDFLGVPVLRAGLPLPMDEDDMLRRFEGNEVTIAIDLGVGNAHARIWTCDLSYDYVTINGDYRT
ncbi:MAG: bifunctional glutamate N-acetyltransferase/amino-acid acetyltransferase ArgJ [Atopobiaceae bacterium]|nr:bifunctional glutamate N-acetyltransferase/amino-acid acetyltransferase ArgJ [Atopobiaceae bacterium]MDO4404372.1 bifunctional glutamate N-acetyltransferase/amino-acid acetyltransferase ArgJ [Atopobiaceae bacterium]